MPFRSNSAVNLYTVRVITIALTIPTITIQSQTSNEKRSCSVSRSHLLFLDRNFKRGRQMDRIGWKRIRAQLRRSIYCFRQRQLRSSPTQPPLRKDLQMPRSIPFAVTGKVRRASDYLR